MNDAESPHRIRLLNDAMADPESDRAASLNAVLSAVREHRGAVHRRRARRTTLAASALLLAAMTAIWFLTPRPAPVTDLQPAPGSPVVPRGLEIVRSGEPDPATRFRTSPNLVETVRSRPFEIPVVRTDPLRVPDTIDDTALFALLGGRPAAIVRPPGALAQLLLLDEP